MSNLTVMRAAKDCSVARHSRNHLRITRLDTANVARASVIFGYGWKMEDGAETWHVDGLVYIISHGQASNQRPRPKVERFH
jgi:hypothetical protein